jgi:THAP4-like, heme-binding beta-barrel domain
LEFTSRQVVNAPSANPVEAVLRTLTLDGDALRSALSMAAMGQPMQPHVASVLRRVPD